jgi:hypothetical protein
MEDVARMQGQVARVRVWQERELAWGRERKACKVELAQPTSSPFVFQDFQFDVLKCFRMLSAQRRHRNICQKSNYRADIFLQ